jgi:hypothetical protein
MEKMVAFVLAGALAAGVTVEAFEEFEGQAVEVLSLYENGYFCYLRSAGEFAEQLTADGLGADRGDVEVPCAQK